VFYVVEIVQQDGILIFAFVVDTSFIVVVVVYVVHFLCFQSMFCCSLSLGKYGFLCQMGRVVADNCSLCGSDACVIIFSQFCSVVAFCQESPTVPYPECDICEDAESHRRFFSP